MDSHPESTKYSVFHHTQELFMTQTVVPVQVKDLKNGVQNVLRKVVTCRYLHRSLKLSYGATEWRILLCISMTHSTTLTLKMLKKSWYYVLFKVKTIGIQISLTHSYWLVGVINHFYWECEVLQIVGKETECFKFIEGDALTNTKKHRHCFTNAQGLLFC